MKTMHKELLLLVAVMTLSACGGGGGASTGSSGEPAPIEATDDAFLSVRVDSVQAPLSVLDNDTRDPSAHSVQCVTPTTAGGGVQISEDGRLVLYTAPAGFIGSDSFRYRTDGDEALVELRVIQPDETALGTSSSPPPGGGGGAGGPNYTESSPLDEIRHSQENLEIGVTNYVPGIRNVGDEPGYHKVRLERGVTYGIGVGYYGENQPLIPLVRFYDYHLIPRTELLFDGGVVSFEYEARYSEPHFIEVQSDYISSDLNTCTADCRSEIRADVVDDFRDEIPTNGQAGGTYPVDGSIEADGDVDLFSVAMISGESYRFTVEADALQNVSVLLFSDSDIDTVLAQERNFAPGDDVTIAYTATETTMHYLQVTGDSGTYRLVSEGGDIPAGFDTWARLTGRRVEASHTSNLVRQGDADWYRAFLVAGEPVRVFVEAADSPDAIQAPRVGLFNQNGETLLANGEFDESCPGCSDRVASITFTPRRTGIYFASASSSLDRDPGVYTIGHQTGVTDDPRIDKYADSASTIGYVDSHFEPMYGTLQEAGEEDWFNISITAGDLHRVVLEGRDAAEGGELADPRLRLVDQDGAVLFEAVETSPGVHVLEIDSSISYNSRLASQAYVVVDSDSGAGTGSYTLRLEGGDPPPHQRTWALLAPSTPVEGYYSSRGGDTDLYRLEVSEGHRYRIEAQASATGMGTATSTSLELLRLGEVESLAADVVRREQRNAEILYTATADEILFVETYTTGLPGSYRLSVTDLDAAQGCL